MSAAANKITVLGVGRCGLHIITELHGNTAASGLRLLALDTDKTALDNCPLPEADKLLAGFAWRQGRGCGGNTIFGQRAVADERPRLEAELKNSSLLFVTGGLGGGTASAAMTVINSVAHKYGVPTVFFLTIPFMLEGHSKRNIAERALTDDLLPAAEAVLAMPNDLLFSVLSNTASLNDGFKLADIQMARTILGVSMVFSGSGALAAEYESLCNLLRRKKSFCSIGVGVGSSADGSDRCAAALERMLHSPLLGGVEKIAEADALLVSLLGGKDLQLGETRQLLETAVKMANPEAQIAVNAGISDDMSDSVQLSVVAIKFDASEEVKRTTEALLRSGKARKSTAATPHEQLSLFPKEDTGCGVMDKTVPVIVNGENLDVPTFRRRRLEIVGTASGTR